MDKLSVSSSPAQGNAVKVLWKWRQQSANQPLMGEINVDLDESHRADREILAELSAISWLLEKRKVHGINRLGNGITIAVSFGAIRKALLKGAQKKEGKGKTDKPHVAACAALLATKYFEADIVVEEWLDEEPKSFEHAEISVGSSFVRPSIYCGLLGRDVVVTRHAMQRYIGRIETSLGAESEDDLSDVSDAHWTAAWKWFERVLKVGSNLRKANILPDRHKKIVRKYGHGAEYLWFRDAHAVLVVQPDHGDMVLRTVLHDDYAAIERLPVQMGQILVAGHTRLRRSA